MGNRPALCTSGATLQAACECTAQRCAQPPSVVPTEAAFLPSSPPQTNAQCSPRHHLLHRGLNPWPCGFRRAAMASEVSVFCKCRGTRNLKAWGEVSSRVTDGEFETFRLCTTPCRLQLAAGSRGGAAFRGQCHAQPVHTKFHHTARCVKCWVALNARTLDRGISMSCVNVC